MQKRYFTTGIFVGLLAIIAAMNSLFVVSQMEQALVLEFGKVVRDVKEPGLKFKIPFIQNVIFFDRRLLDFNAEQKETNASDQKSVIIDAFVRYRITNPLKFYQTVQNENGVRDRLNDIVESSLKKVVGSYPLNALLSPTRATIMNKIMSDVNLQTSGKLTDKDATKAARDAAAMGGFGIEVVDVRIKRADLPDTNSQAIYLRMQTDRQREATELRAQGDEAAQRIRSKAERERTVILAESQKKAEIIRGEGDAVATKTYGDAFSRDREFYDFYRTLQAYRKVLNGSDTTMVLSPDSEFLKYLDGGASVP